MATSKSASPRGRARAARPTVQARSRGEPVLSLGQRWIWQWHIALLGRLIALEVVRFDPGSRHRLAFDWKRTRSADQSGTRSPGSSRSARAGTASASSARSRAPRARPADRRLRSALPRWGRGRFGAQSPHATHEGPRCDSSALDRQGEAARSRREVGRQEPGQGKQAVRPNLCSPCQRTSSASATRRSASERSWASHGSDQDAIHYGSQRKLSVERCFEGQGDG